MKFSRPLRDYRGMALCDPCWNSRHWHYEVITDKLGRKRKTNRKILDCIGAPCECPCTELVHEKHPKVKPDHSLQMEIDTGMLPDTKHRDE